LAGRFKQEPDMQRVQQLTAADFSREVYFSPVPVVVDVFADWCGPCRALAPVLEQLAGRYQGRVKFVKVNLDEEPDVARVFRVESVPTLLFFQNGELRDRVAGIPSSQWMIAKLDELAGTAGPCGCRGSRCSA
jgi:thioredoxin 1